MARRASRALAAVARRLSRRPCNRRGADKTFVHKALHDLLLYRKALGRA